MKASIRNNRIVHIWNQSPFNNRYYRSNCGLVYTIFSLKTIDNDKKRECIQCKKGEAE